MINGIILTTKVVSKPQVIYEDEKGELMKTTDAMILKNLECLGLTKNEAKTYLFLLRSGESYGNEISKQAGVPGPKVYETLNKLVNKGLAYPVKASPVTYRPLPLEQFVESKQKEVTGVTTFLKINRDNIEKGETQQAFWQLHGRDNLLQKATELIQKANNNIMISLWEDEALELKEDLAIAQHRGVNVVSIQYGEPDCNVGEVYKHIMVASVHERHSSEMFLLIDDVEGMFMYFEGPHGWTGYHTASPALARVIANYLRHDIYINRVLNDNYEMMKKQYGENLEGLLNL